MNMRKTKIGLLVAMIVTIALVAAGRSGTAQRQPQAPRAASPPAAQSRTAAPLYKLEDAYLRWPLPAGEQAYAAIDGKHMQKYVVEQAAIARRYRDQGHPQFWGRITGTSSD